MNAAMLRSRAIRATRAFFSRESIIEVRTNRLVASPAMEPYIDAFALNDATRVLRGYLATSPEFAMKKIFGEELISSPEAAGIYEIAPVFRDDRPGKNHSVEFTMIEWYKKDCSLAQIVDQCIRLIRHLASEMRISDFETAVTHFDIVTEFEKYLGHPLPAGSRPYTALYRSHFKELPHHLNGLDAEIACFNLLFDSWLLPVIKNQAGFVAVSGYPECLAAMARVKNATAERTEIYYQGLELANAYQEEHDADAIRARWAENNEIRRLRGVAEHPLDAELLAALGAMRGTSGIAVGLERVLMAFFPGISAGSFGQLSV